MQGQNSRTPWPGLAFKTAATANVIITMAGSVDKVSQLCSTLPTLMQIYIHWLHSGRTTRATQAVSVIRDVKVSV